MSSEQKKKPAGTALTVESQSAERSNAIHIEAKKNLEDAKKSEKEKLSESKKSPVIGTTNSGSRESESASQSGSKSNAIAEKAKEAVKKTK